MNVCYAQEDHSTRGEITAHNEMVRGAQPPHHLNGTTSGERRCPSPTVSARQLAN